MLSNIYKVDTYHLSKHLDMLNKNTKVHSQEVLALEGPKKANT